MPKPWSKIAVIVLILFVIIMLLPTHVIRYITWNFADINDHTQFPFRKIQNTAAPEEAFELPYQVQDISLPDGLVEGKEFDSFKDFLKEYKTTSFLLIKNDSILSEYYGENCNESSIFPGFSIAKSIVSALTGVAIEEGYFAKGMDTKVGECLPDVKDVSLQEISLQQLLGMKAGLDYEERYYSPFGGMARFYYGTNLKRYVARLKSGKKLSEEYKYQSASAQVVGMMIESVTGKTIDKYLQEKIWMQAGMKYPATWNIDSEKHGQIKCFCCFNATAMDFALFGRLYLNEGKFGEQQIIPGEWIKASATIKDESLDSQGYPYTLFWRATNNGEMFAKGIMGQYIYLNLKENIIIVRTGKTSGDLDWVRIFGMISKELQKNP